MGRTVWLATRVGRWAASGLVFGAVSLGVVAPVAAQTVDPGTYTGVTPPQVGSVQTGVASAQLAAPTSGTSSLPFTGTDVGSVQTGVASAQLAAPTSGTSSLPFTGTDAVELAAIGVVLIGGGFVLRVSARRRQV